MLAEQQPDLKISVKQTFNIDSDLEVPAFSEKNDYVPEIDNNYILTKKPLSLFLPDLQTTKG